MESKQQVFDFARVEGSSLHQQPLQANQGFAPTRKRPHVYRQLIYKSTIEHSGGGGSVNHNPNSLSQNLKSQFKSFEGESREYSANLMVIPNGSSPKNKNPQLDDSVTSSLKHISSLEMRKRMYRDMFENLSLQQQ